MHIAILTRQISHYHDARYRGTAGRFDKISVISVAGEGDFSELLASRFGAYKRIHLYRNRENYKTAVRGGQLSSDLYALLDRLMPDVIAIAGWATSETASAIMWAKANLRPVVIMSKSQSDDAARSWFREWVKAQVVSSCDAALVGGPPHASYITSLGLPPERVFFGYNAVDNDHFAQGANAARLRKKELQATLGLPMDYFLASARFITKKNLPALVRAHASVTSRHPDAPALFVLGDGPERNEIEAAIAVHPKPNNVILAGFRSYDDLPAYYGLARAFVHVSTTEQWGLVVNEAMAAGTPVIVSDTCGVARTVVRTGRSGLLVKPTEEDIADAIERIVCMPDGELAELGTNAQEAILNWGPSRFGSGLKEAADAAFAKSPSRLRLYSSSRLIAPRKKISFKCDLRRCPSQSPLQC